MTRRLKIVVLSASCALALVFVWSTIRASAVPSEPTERGGRRASPESRVPDVVTLVAESGGANHVREPLPVDQTVFPIPVTRGDLDATDALVLGDQSVGAWTVHVSIERVRDGIDVVRVGYANEFAADNFEFTLTCGADGVPSATVSVDAFRDAGGADVWRDIDGGVVLSGGWCGGTGPRILRFYVGGELHSSFVDRLASVSLP